MSILKKGMLLSVSVLHHGKIHSLSKHLHCPPLQCPAPPYSVRSHFIKEVVYMKVCRSKNDPSVCLPTHRVNTPILQFTSNLGLLGALVSLMWIGPQNQFSHISPSIKDFRWLAALLLPHLACKTFSCQCIVWSICLKLSNWLVPTQLRGLSQQATTPGKVLKFFGMLGLVTCVRAGRKHDLWRKEQMSRYIPVYKFRQAMPKGLSDDLMASIQFRFVAYLSGYNGETGPQTNEMHCCLIDGFLVALDRCQVEIIISFEQLCADELISSYHASTRFKGS